MAAKEFVMTVESDDEAEAEISADDNRSLDKEIVDINPNFTFSLEAAPSHIASCDSQWSFDEVKEMITGRKVVDTLYILVQLNKYRGVKLTQIREFSSLPKFPRMLISRQKWWS
jgi:hypothetical protein